MEEKKTIPTPAPNPKETPVAAGAAAKALTEEELLKHIRDFCSEPRTPGVIGMLSPQFESFDAQAQTLTLSFPCLEWEVSPRNNMMGGVLCAVFDIAMGLLTGIYAREHYVTTLELTTRFIKPVRLGETLVVKTQLLSQGKTILNMRATAHAQSDGRLLGAAEAAFMLVKSLPATYQG